MKQETLKKIVELADGFEWLENSDGWCITYGVYQYFDTSVLYKNIYPLLIRRAVEGWNKSKSDFYFIDLYSDHLDYDANRYKKAVLIYRNYTKTDYLTPQEQAIEACLIELLEKR